MTRALVTQTDQEVQEYVQEMLCAHYDTNLDPATQLRVLCELERQAGLLKDAHIKLYRGEADPQPAWGEGTDLS